MKWFSYGTWGLLLVAALATVEGVAADGRYWWLVGFSAIASAATLFFAATRPGARGGLRRWFVQPLFTVFVVLLGYPLAEMINHPENHRITNIFVCIGLALIVLSVPRSKLSQAIDLEREASTEAQIQELRERVDRLAAAATIAESPASVLQTGPPDSGRGLKAADVLTSLALMVALLILGRD